MKHVIFSHERTCTSWTEYIYIIYMGDVDVQTKYTYDSRFMPSCHTYHITCIYSIYLESSTKPAAASICTAFLENRQRWPNDMFLFVYFWRSKHRPQARIMSFEGHNAWRVNNRFTGKWSRSGRPVACMGAIVCMLCTNVCMFWRIHKWKPINPSENDSNPIKY